MCGFFNKVFTDENQKNIKIRMFLRTRGLSLERLFDFKIQYGPLSFGRLSFLGLILSGILNKIFILFKVFFVFSKFSSKNLLLRLDYKNFVAFQAINFFQIQSKLD